MQSQYVIIETSKKESISSGSASLRKWKKVLHGKQTSSSRAELQHSPMGVYFGKRSGDLEGNTAAGVRKCQEEKGAID